MKLRIAALVMAMIATLPGAARAAAITLDFDSVATGSEIISTPLVTSLGTITASVSGGDLFITPIGLQHVASDDSYGQLAFDFDVATISFLLAPARGGVFTAQALDASFAIVDAFFDADASDSSPSGPVTLSGAGIRYLRFGDFPDGLTAGEIDDVRISDVAEVPEPATMLLLGSGLIGAGVQRYRRRRGPSA